eukprot:GEMP01078493.1.p1 GENE.GEMP01078493.1~~GEMP01078493.1.p1  ORF type:complete len:146 (+),score=28.65 GEMP01078493.1:209-646(+)
MVTKSQKVASASKTAKAVKTAPTRKVSKERYTTHFYRPKTQRHQKAPKYPRKSRPTESKMDKFRVLSTPMTTESAMKKIEEINTLVFLCDVKANKRQIRDAIEKTYEVSVQKVNTLIRPDGKKKAYIRLTPDFDALDVANRIGII